MDLTQNRLLAALSPASLARWGPSFREVRHQRQEVVLEESLPVERVYFPLTGWLCNVVLLANGTTAEVGLVGNEGMVGMSAFRGGTASFYRTMVQSRTTTCVTIARADLAEAFNADTELRAILLRYAEAVAMHTAYTAACNGWHDIPSRLARWLLLVHDRANEDELPVTHEFLAMMLCAHRPRITIAASEFQRAGIISYRKGAVKILERARLEERACECYGLMKRFIEDALSEISRR